MLAILSLVCGAFLSFTIMQNGDLSAFMGNCHATVIVHAVGLVALLLWMLLRREKLHWDRRTPWYFCLGGVLGVVTVVCSNLAYASLGVSVTLALGLLGQAATGGLIDHFGLFHVRRQRFRKQHLLSFALIIAGAAAMLWL